MLAFLKFVGVLNAALWLGAIVFTSFVILPIFFSPEVTPGLVHKYYAGRIAQLVVQRLFWLQLICGLIALLHYGMEHLYAGKVLPRFAVSSVVAIVVLVAAGGFLLQPKMDRWHLVKYATNTQPAQRAEAAKKFGLWHGVSQIGNLLILAGVFVHFVRQANAPTPTKFSRGPRGA
jgi:Domain of unknown function (DUF4149)